MSKKKQNFWKKFPEKWADEDYEKWADEDYEKWDNSVEGVLYNLNISLDLATITNEDEEILVETILKLPEDVRNKVSDELLIIPIGVLGTSSFFRFYHHLKDGSVYQPYIIINFRALENETKERKMSVIAHEIAHFWLGHHEDKKESSEVKNKRIYKEREADDLIEKWGFQRAYKEEDYKKM